MPAPLKLQGVRFGRLTVISEKPDSKGYWRCRCDCGREDGMFKKLLSMLTPRLNDTHVVRADDPGMATHLIIHVDSEGRRHEYRVGQTAYGKGHFPAGGHKPDVVFEVDKRERKS